MTLQIISSDDDTWDDIDIEDNSFMYHTSRGIYSYYPDKDLSRACHRVLSPSFSDDDDTASTSAASLQSDLLSFDDHDYPLSEMGDLGTPTNGSSSNYTTKMQSRTLLNLSASSSSSKIESNSNSNINRNNSLFDLLKDYDGPGTITRLGRTGGRVHVDVGDWTQDLDVPSTLKLPTTKRGSASNTAINQQSSATLGGGDEYDDHDPFADFQDDNDIFTGQLSEDSSTTASSSSQKRVRFDQMTTTATRTGPDLEQQKHAEPTTTTTTSAMPLHQQKWKEEEDDEGFDDIDIPIDLGTRSVKPHQTRQINATAATCNSTNNDNNTGYKSSPLPSNIQKQLAQFKETDTDDFLDGLDIKDDVFKATTSNSSSSSSSSNKKEKLSLESKLPRPKRYQQQKSTATTTRSTSSSRKKISYHENRLDRLTAPTYASIQRGTNTTPTTTTTSSPTNILRTRQSNPRLDQIKPRTAPLQSLARSHRLQPIYTHSTNKYSNTVSTSTTFIRTSDGSSLMAKPRMGRINYGNGSELDHLDDLAVWKRPSPSKFSLKTTPCSDGTKSGSVGTGSSTRKSDMSSKPWRCNMSKRKLTLIKPEEQKVAKEINDMRYDERERRWHGNEQETRTFDTPAKRRPALIKNMMNSRAAKSTSAMVVGNMTFDQQKMSWNTRNGDEVDVLAHIDDLSENEALQPHHHHHHRLRSVPANHDQGNSNQNNGISSNGNINYDTSRMAPFENSTFHTESHLYRKNDINSTLNKTTERTTTLLSTGPTDFIAKASLDHQHQLHHHQDQPGQNRTLPSSGLHRSSAGSREFDLPIDLQIQMADQEEEHKAYFGAWPLRDECEMTNTPSGYSVPQNTYILY